MEAIQTSEVKEVTILTNDDRTGYTGKDVYFTIYSGNKIIEVVRIKTGFKVVVYVDGKIGAYAIHTSLLTSQTSLLAYLVRYGMVAPALLQYTNQDTAFTVTEELLRYAVDNLNYTGVRGDY